MVDFFEMLNLLLCFATCFALGIGVIVLSGVWDTPPRKPIETLRILRQTIIQACHEAWRG